MKIKFTICENKVKRFERYFHNKGWQGPCASSDFKGWKFYYTDNGSKSIYYNEQGYLHPYIDRNKIYSFPEDFSTIKFPEK